MKEEPNYGPQNYSRGDLETAWNAYNDMITNRLMPSSQEVRARWEAFAKYCDIRDGELPGTNKKRFQRTGIL